ncbi:MAG TPA: glycosyltransferase, partial [Syntrophales bacterium]|nr:glycosyltransferase [Syntrophales bacterium]
CGVPVVSTRAEYGPEEIIVPGESGLLVDIGDSRALADALAGIVRDRDLSMRLSENGSKRVQALFSKKLQIPALENIILSSLAAKG